MSFLTGIQFDMVKSVALIPARSSKGIKDKNLVRINGMTLLEHAINFCQNLSFLDEVYVSTDSEVYLKYCKTAGSKVHNRLSQHATDDSLVIHTINHFIDTCLFGI